MVRIAGFVATGALIALLSGCAPAAAVPGPMTADEVRQTREAQALDWWTAMFPAEPMPRYEPVEVVAQGEPNPGAVTCVLESGLPGVEQHEGSYVITGDANTDDVNRLLFRCYAQHTVEITDPMAWGYYSQAQLDWLYDYYATRLVPCLRLAGFHVGEQPARDEFVDKVFGGWSPYYAMTPVPITRQEWDRIDLRCPPPPFGAEYRPGE